MMKRREGYPEKIRRFGLQHETFSIRDLFYHFDIFHNDSRGRSIKNAVSDMIIDIFQLRFRMDHKALF